MENSKEVSFLQFTLLCEQNPEKRYVAECIDIIKNKDCLFHPGASLPHERALSLYALRLSIAKDIIPHDMGYLADFEALVENIREKKSDHVGITSLSGNNFLYLIFHELKTRLILGILRSTSSMTDQENLATEHIARGLTSGMEKYSKGKLIRAWGSQPEL